MFRIACRQSIRGFAETICPWRRSGSPAPLKLKLSPSRCAAMDSNNALWLSAQAKLQIPSSKLQINPKPQIPNIESTELAGVWGLEIGASLGFGPWSLVLEVSLVFGAWFLELSFVSQRLHRIDFGGAARRQPAGEHGHRAQPQYS